jgi:acetyl-CoA carboxylase carboxyltransferase component
LFNFLPPNAEVRPLLREAKEPVHPLPDIPVDPKSPFNILDLINAIVDNSEYILYKDSFGPSMVCAFAYLNGYPVGLVANQSIKFSGAIDSDASQKTSRFIRLCDAYNIPILTLIDVPGFMPGKREEQKGLLRHGAKLCAAMQTMVPRISVVIRKCYGASAFLMMQTKAQHGDLVLALNSAQIGVMAQTTLGAVKDLDNAAVEQSVKRDNVFYEDSLTTAYSLGLIDEIITPSEIRPRLSQHLEYLYDKHQPQRLAKKHIIEP